MERENLKSGKTKILKPIKDIFIISKKEISKLEAKALFQDILLASIIYLLATPIGATEISSKNISGYAVKLDWYLFFILCLYLGNTVFYILKEHKIELKKENNLLIKNWHYFVEILHYFRDFIIRYLNYNRRIYVRINLGHDNLKEIDILRLIAKNVIIQFNEFSRIGIRLSLADIPWLLFKLIFIFTLSSMIYSIKMPNYVSNNMSNNMTSCKIEIRCKIVKYFPSQQKIFGKCERNNNIECKEDKDRKIIQTITIYLDTIINTMFYKFIALLNDIPIFKNLTNISIFPERIDYVFIVCFVMIWYLRGLPFRYKLFGMRTFGTVRRNITELNDSINAQVTRESGAEASIIKEKFPLLRIFDRRSKAYPRADAREIEKQLIDVLNEIDKIPKLIGRPQFIFIFDELDKIEPYVNTIEKEETQALTVSGSVPLSIQEPIERQHVILKILSNLKYFLTTAKAKFIFIAGREMYDASLADVSDRNYFMGSIFHDVIYVNSFLTDSTDQKIYDITNMTEQYVCKYLIPNYYREERTRKEKKAPKDSLKTYREYLQDEIFNIKQDDMKKHPIEKLKIEKLIVTINNFITYLTYRSNGSPKKLTRYFEKHIVQPPKKELESSKNLCAGRNSNNMYLEFGFYDQYTLGLVSYIATPIILAIKRTMKDFGDKILVSTAFILDHIYKYHRHAFTWRSLEVTPEILDINKAPELRELIERIIQFLSKNNIHEILSGPYNFRFIKRMADEISYLSKISEIESAAFNFTLDESLSLKRHYKAYQKSLEKKYGNFLNSDKNIAFIESISFVHMILGELYFYDEEYHDAIIELLESIQQLRSIDIEKMDISTLYIYIRAMMLLGLAYEKGKSFTSAFTTYEKLTSVIIEHKEKVINNINKSNSPMSVFENKRHIYQPLLAKLQIIEKKSLNGITNSDIDRIEEEHKSLRSENISEKFIIESEFSCKIGDILYYKTGLIPGNESIKPNRLKALFSFRKNGFCSGPVNVDKIKTEDAKKIKYPCRACEYYMKSLRILCRDHLGIEIVASIFLGKANTKNILINMLKKIVDDDSRHYIQKNAIVSKAIGNVLSNIGDTFLSCVEPKLIQTDDFIDFLGSIDDDDITINADNLITFIDTHYKDNRLYEVFAFYCASALFFITARMHKEYSFQFSKILSLIQECLKVSPDKLIIRCDKLLIKTIGSTIIKRIIQGIYKSYENVHRLEIEKVKEIFDNSDKVDYDNLSLSGDIREVIINYSEIKLKCECPDVAFNDNFISPYTTIYTIRNRVIELNFKANMNENLLVYLAHNTNYMESMKDDYQNYKLVGKPYDPLNKIKKDIIISFNKLITIVSINKSAIKDAFRKDIESQFVIEFLITDSIFCLREIIKICKTYGFSYDANHSFIASTYLKLAIWCDYYRAYRIFEKFYNPLNKQSHQTNIEDTLKKLIGTSEMITIDTKYQYEMARYHCLCAKETHSERKAYKNMIETMYYLNDDFNDSLYHFYAAVERFRINSGQIKEMIDITRERTEGDTLYDPESYYPQRGSTNATS
ncbi:MAG: hypothetical protein HQL02_05620 [Nitrospirae bacterium]|nr:hypothetical protein [Nitrospirota bacterium]